MHALAVDLSDVISRLLVKLLTLLIGGLDLWRRLNYLWPKPFISF